MRSYDGVWPSYAECAVIMKGLGRHMKGFERHMTGFGRDEVCSSYVEDFAAYVGFAVI